jgi:hypothetical protein
MLPLLMLAVEDGHALAAPRTPVATSSRTSSSGLFETNTQVITCFVVRKPTLRSHSAATTPL